MLFGINQGGIFDDLRIENMKEIAKLNLDGYAIGGLALGETKEQEYKAIDAHKSVIPKNKVTQFSRALNKCFIFENVICFNYSITK